MPTLFLHAGQPKTGSTYMQSVFDQNVDTLRAWNIFFPRRHPLTASLLLARGETNALRATRADEMFEPVERQSERSLLISNERFFYRALQWKVFEKETIKRVAREAGFDRVEMLILTRDPVSHCASLCQQTIKSDGMGGFVRTQDAADAAAQHFNQPELLAAFLDTWADDDWINFTIRSYSRNAATIHAVYEDWMGLPSGTLRAPGKRVVNRSMTRSEQAVQLRLNASLHKDATFNHDTPNPYADGQVYRNAGQGPRLGWTLCDRLPAVAADPVYPSRVAQEEMIARQRPFMDRVESRMPAGEAYEHDLRDVPGSDQPEAYAFDQAQLDLMVDYLSSAVVLETSKGEARVGQMLADQGDLAGAERSFRKAIALHDRNVGAYVGLMTVVQRLEREDEAYEIASQAETLFPNSARFPLFKADRLNLVGAADQADAAYRDLIWRFPDNGRAYFNYAKFLERRGRLCVAAAMARRAGQLVPDNERFQTLKQRLEAQETADGAAE